MRVAITVDVEQDCPPFKNTERGITEGMPRLLGLLEEKNIKATFFTTGIVAERHPRMIEDIVGLEHELGCHGLTHTRLDKIDPMEAKKEITASTEILRCFYPTISFRAPCLQLPKHFLKDLFKNGYKIDSSEGKHKNPFLKMRTENGILRVPASTTSIMLRMGKFIRNLHLSLLKDPIVLFFHPWEFIDLRNEKLRIDCRFNTGKNTLTALDQTIDFFKMKKADFIKMEELYV